VIYHKRLEQGRFAMPRYDVLSGSYSLMWAELVSNQLIQTVNLHLIPGFAFYVMHRAILL
jgi:hypothetical protein